MASLGDVVGTNNDSRSQPLLRDDPSSGNGDNTEDEKPKLTCVRWWILFVYCCIALCQSATWNILSPINPSVILAYPTWSQAYINWVINAANFSFGIMLWPTPALIKKLGPRWVTILSAICVLLGAGLRVIPVDGEAFQVVMIISMLFNGLGGE